MTLNHFMSFDDALGGYHVALSSRDASLILQYSVGLITRVPVATACASDWGFVPVPAAVPNQRLVPLQTAGSCQRGAIAYEPLAGDEAGQDFAALACGDVTGNWTGAAVTAAPDSVGVVRLGAPRRRADAVYSCPSTSIVPWSRSPCASRPTPRRGPHGGGWRALGSERRWGLVNPNSPPAQHLTPNASQSRHVVLSWHPSIRRLRERRLLRVSGKKALFFRTIEPFALRCDVSISLRGATIVVQLASEGGHLGGASYTSPCCPVPATTSTDPEHGLA